LLKSTIANKQIDIRKTKLIYKLYTSGTRKCGISQQLCISRVTVRKYIVFFKRYRFTVYEVEKMTLEELHGLFKDGQKRKSQRLLTLRKYFPYFDKEIIKTGVTRQLLWRNIMPGTLMASSSHSPSSGKLNGARRTLR
jgi:hypothetical protein